MRKLTNKIKAFSLVETIITLAIFGVLIAMITQVLLINISVSRKAFIRTRVREEIAEIMGLIQRDIRNASVIGECGEFDENGLAVQRCQISHAEEFIWTDNCPDESDTDRICKLDLSDPPNVLFQSSDLLTIDDISFEINLATGDDGTRSTIIVTLVASTSNPNFDVNNQVRQVAVSTRNFTLGSVGDSSGGSGNSSCTYSSTGAAVREFSSTTWEFGSPTFNCGDTLRVAGFHNGNTSSFPSDVTLTMTEPGGVPTNVNNNGFYVIPASRQGTYSLRVTTNNQTGASCEDNLTFTCVLPSPTPTPTP